MGFTEEGRACAAALSFLTRLGTPRMVEDAVLARAVRYYAVVGFTVGGLSALAVGLAMLWGARESWALAWLYVLLMLWLTRGMHGDGLADVGDAWGSGAQGEIFWRILQDSRLGAFGAMALFLGLSGLLLGAQTQISRALHGGMPEFMGLLPLVLAPVYGRALAVLLAFAAPAHEPHSLGGKAAAGATGPVALVYAGVSLLCLAVLPWREAFVTLAGSVLLLVALKRLAKQQGGSNGDFFGAVIVGGEILFLIAW